MVLERLAVSGRERDIKELEAGARGSHPLKEQNKLGLCGNYYIPLPPAQTKGTKINQQNMKTKSINSI